MARRTAPRRAAALAAVLLGLLWAGAQTPAYASITASGSTSSTRSVSTGTFAVIPTLATSGTPVPAPAALTFTALTPRAFYDAVNTGTISLVAASYNINLTYVGTGTPTVTLVACPGNSWNQTLNTCPVGTVTVGSWGAGSSSDVASTQVPVNQNDRLHLRATLTTTGVMVSGAATANVTVSSGPTRQIRAAVTTNA